VLRLKGLRGASTRQWSWTGTAHAYRAQHATGAEIGKFNGLPVWLRGGDGVKFAAFAEENSMSSVSKKHWFQQRRLKSDEQGA
jgi:hypothetical protein